MNISRCLLAYQTWYYMTLQINTSVLFKIVPCLFLFPLLFTRCFMLFSNTWHFLQQPKPKGLMMWARCKGKFSPTCLTLAGTQVSGIVPIGIGGDAFLPSTRDPFHLATQVLNQPSWYLLEQLLPSPWKLSFYYDWCDFKNATPNGVH